VRFLSICSILICACTPKSDSVRIQFAFATQPVNDDPDDVAIWVNKAAPQRSLIFGTNKAEAPTGALFVYDMNGKIKQTIAGIDRPNNIDVEYHMSIGGRVSDIVVLTERRLNRLRVMRVWPDGSGVEENSEIPVFEGQKGDFAEPMGIGLYRRPSDGSVYAIVGRKNGPRKGYLWEYRLFTDDKGRVRGEKVREFGDYSGKSEIEAIAVVDEAGFVYYADEDDSIRKWHADPDHPDASKEVARFGVDGFRGNREGIAIYPLSEGEGYVIVTDQIQENSEYRIYNRRDPSKLLKVVSGGADSTDGLEVTPAYLGREFARGLLIAMNSDARNFLVYRWADVADTGSPKLK
jgi:3-phytase